MSYGLDSDIWGFVGADSTATIAMIGQSYTPNASEATAEDSNGDVLASTLHDTFVEVERTYRVKAGTVGFYDTAKGVDVRLGKVKSGKVITKIAANTANKEFPTITIGGRSTVMSDSQVAKYRPGFTVIGRKGAQSFGGDAGAAARVVSSSVTAQVGVSIALDSEGDELALDVYGGRVEASNGLVGVTGAPAFTADTDWTLKPAVSVQGSNNAYQTGAASLFQNLAADT